MVKQKFETKNDEIVYAKKKLEESSFAQLRGIWAYLHKETALKTIRKFYPTLTVTEIKYYVKQAINELEEYTNQIDKDGTIDVLHGRDSNRKEDD
jgi:hypothetical protein